MWKTVNIKHANGRDDFRKICNGDFFINMTKESGRYSLHKKDFKSCPYSKCSSEFIDFDSEKEAKESGLNWKYCMNCIRNEEKGGNI